MRLPVPSISLLVFGLVFLLVGTAEAQRTFAQRFSANRKGDITFIGNSLLACSATVGDNSVCDLARQNISATFGQSGGYTLISMENIDVDGFVDENTDTVDDTVNSSEATLSLPAGSSVLFAGLYWGGTSTSSGRDKIRFRAPGQSVYTEITASTLDVIGTGGQGYQGFFDVTSVVQSAGNGVYRAGNVLAGTGSGQFAGWILVVAYEDPAQPPRNLVVFDGYVAVSPPQTVSITGILTPPSGTVASKVGAVTWLSESAFTGDFVTLDSTSLGNSLNPGSPANMFNGSFTRIGSGGAPEHFTAKNPDFRNSLFFDVDIFDATGILGNSVTSATAQFGTGGDAYRPGVITFATDIFEPDLSAEFFKAVTDLNGGTIEEGDTLEYTLQMKNTGTDTANNVVITDAVPSNVTFVANSIQIMSGANTGTKTDATGDDQGELTGGAVVVRVGTGANSSTGGTLAIGESSVVRFRVRVDTPTTLGTLITNAATAAYVGATSGSNLAATSRPATGQTGGVSGTVGQAAPTPGYSPEVPFSTPIPTPTATALATATPVATATPENQPGEAEVACGISGLTDIDVSRCTQPRADVRVRGTHYIMGINRKRLSGARDYIGYAYPIPRDGRRTTRRTRNILLRGPFPTRAATFTKLPKGCWGFQYRIRRENGATLCSQVKYLRVR